MFNVCIQGQRHAVDRNKTSSELLLAHVLFILRDAHDARHGHGVWKCSYAAAWLIKIEAIE